ncbi:hypothetical protein [Bradyrhizobium japonicum]|uniref:hypothetical protein n=1 Tax=Bradyrhizobium japonicum TaxID=375 RepID=UPI001BAB487C|nr:hypothetical protein [Bradyrhizobium japonicum]MBR0912216.1 hypothetical protein [Bradyrhizobium japonicum]
MSMFLSRVLAGREVEQARSSERRRRLDRRGQRAAQAPMLSNDAPAAFANSHEEYGVYFCRAFGAIDVNQLFRKGIGLNQGRLRRLLLRCAQVLGSMRRC